MKTAPTTTIERFEDVIIEEPPRAARVDALDASRGIVTGILAGSALWLLILAVLSFR